MAKSADKDNAKKKGTNWLLIALLLGGGLFVLFICCTGAGVGGYFVFFSGPSIAGKWQMVDEAPGGSRTWEFNRDATGVIRIRGNKNGKMEEATGFFDYKVIKGDPQILEFKVTRAEGTVAEGMRREIGQVMRFQMVLEQDTMRLTMLDNRRQFLDRIELKRVR